MLPRVVITGMGVVSPNGIGKEDFCRALLAGKSGVKRISRFDPSSLPVHIAGEIPEFDELAWVDARERKHVSRVVPLSVAASTEAIKDAGLRCPEDISVVGFDDIASAAYHTPSLTTIRQPLRRMGEMAAQQLLKRIQNPNEAFPDTIMFEPELMKRESTMAIPVDAAPRKGRSSGSGIRPVRRAR